jgi:hypothetical protein
MRKFLLAAGAITLALAMASPAAALTTFTTIGQVGVWDFDGVVEGNPDADLDADLTLTLLSVTGGTDFNFSYLLENNSTGDDDGARLTAFGFNVDPNFSDASVTGTFDAWASGNTPGGLPNVEFCATAGNKCSGGTGGGVLAGQDGTGFLTLNFTSAPTAGVTLADLYVRYQSLGADREGSGVGTGTPCLGCGGGANEVPEPATWAMMILGFGGVGAVMRRRRYATATAV